MLRQLIWLISYPILRNIKKIEGTRNGETCYIFGDGVSLKYFDLSKFSNHPALVCNALPFHRDFKYLNCLYWVVVGPELFWSRLQPKQPKRSEIFKPIEKQYFQKMRATSVPKILHLFSFPKMLRSHAYFIFDKFPKSDQDSNFIASTKKGYAGSFNALITIAVYLGFKNAILIGMDYTHSNSRSHHWYESGAGIRTFHPDYNKEFIDHASQKINLITVTLQGKSEVMDSITYKELTGETPIFRENTDLASNDFLSAFSSFPGYSIFSSTVKASENFQM